MASCSECSCAASVNESESSNLRGTSVVHWFVSSVLVRFLTTAAVLLAKNAGTGFRGVAVVSFKSTLPLIGCTAAPQADFRLVLSLEACIRCVRSGDTNDENILGMGALLSWSTYGQRRKDALLETRKHRRFFLIVGKSMCSSLD